MDDLFKLSQWELKDLETLVPNPKNDNKHKEEHVDLLAKVMKARGVRHPIIVSKRSGFIVAGHLRLAAARKLGLNKYPVEEQEFKSEADEYAFLTSDNNVARYAELDEVKMLENLKGLDVDVETLDFEELGLLDFEVPEVEVLPEGNEDATPELTPDPVSKRGDVWLLGPHRVLCGDSTLFDDVEKLMAGQKAVLVHTDPPYNVDYDQANRPKPGTKDLGKIENDKLNDSDFLEFLTNAYGNAYLFTSENSTMYSWYASSETLSFYPALKESGWSFNQLLVWKKPMLLGRSKYQWAHEPCLFAIKGSPHFTKDRTKTTVWDFGGYDKSKNVHPTQKPVFIPEEAINNSSKKNDLVLDLFLGSGSTLIACEKNKRTCYGLELEPSYVDVIVKRWQEYTGKDATLEATGQTFNELLK